jgi:hypothetical protein
LDLSGINAQETGENFRVRNFMNFTPCRGFSKLSNLEGREEWVIWHVWDRGKFMREILTGGEYLENLDIDDQITIHWR